MKVIETLKQQWLITGSTGLTIGVTVWYSADEKLSKKKCCKVAMMDNILLVRERDSKESAADMDNTHSAGAQKMPKKCVTFTIFTAK